MLPPFDFQSLDFSDTNVWSLKGFPQHGALITPPTIITNVSVKGNSVDAYIERLLGSIIVSGDGNKQSVLLGYNISTPNVDSNVLYGQLNSTSSATDRHIQISLQGNSSLVGLFGNNSTDNLTSISTLAVDFSDGVDRIMVVTVDGDADSLKIYNAKTTDALISTVALQFDSFKGGVGYVNGPPASPKPTTVGASFTAQAQISTGDQLSILQVWKTVALDAAQVQEAFDAVVLGGVAAGIARSRQIVLMGAGTLRTN